MRIRTALWARNEGLVQAREFKGLSQEALARNAKVPDYFVWAIEQFDYSRPKNPRRFAGHVEAIARTLDIGASEVVDAELIGEKMIHEIAAVREMGLRELAAMFDARNFLPSPEDKMLQREDAAILKEAMARLTYREKTIIEMRYGLGINPVMTLIEVGRAIRLTSERARQLEDKAFRKMRWWATRYAGREQRKMLRPLIETTESRAEADTDG